MFGEDFSGVEWGEWERKRRHQSHPLSFFPFRLARAILLLENLKEEQERDKWKMKEGELLCMA